MKFEVKLNTQYYEKSYIVSMVKMESASEITLFFLKMMMIFFKILPLGKRAIFVTEFYEVKEKEF